MRSALAVSLALASGAAAALGLGQIQLKSGLGEPLLAEIPIISNDPSELERLRASLASPATFARVGLQPPDAVMADLQFVSALDARGNPVIRVTSTQPITQPLLTFLVEVNWGQGRLVREYSTLIDAPRTAAAPMQPPIQAPQAAPSNTIVREPDPVPATQPAQEADPVASAPPEAESDPEPAPITVPPAQPAPRPVAAAPAAPAAPSPIEGGRYDVQAGDTLSAIAGRIEGVSVNQAMIALLRENPGAFIDGNIHLVKAGAVLQIPDASALAQVDSAEAAALVRSQTQQWREATAAVPQPAVADADPVDAGNAASPAASGRTADARLEIVPPGASDASTAGTQSGTSAGGEGDMLRQELQTTQETLAARDAELDEMKSRLAELEKLQQQQQQLLEMKDSELAAAQQRLAQSNDAQAPMSATPWLVGGGAVLLFALLGWWLGRRRAATPVFRAPPERTSSIADAFPSGAMVAPTVRAEPTPEPVPDVESPASEPARADRAQSTPAEAAPVVAERVDTPEVAPAAAPVVAEEQASLWDRRERDPVPSGRAPTWHDGSRAPATAPVDAASGHDRLELARAYVALGDHGSARQLLQEVAGHGDADARQQAEQMLRDLA
ncbi:ferrous iron transporter B [Lysobacter sp. 13A]|uniref:Ferrous iron transporter B n=2 Tax=Novilysobacter selenitireducens TaxID=2872639 RepID=A0ABS7T7K8_9GAMM|nr:FimV/HubP family polar landmark protein [Lysobacter selenitireducens]MBZ4039854.1 ferrous iron transporter B [Lysobacter selenitireducens]